MLHKHDKSIFLLTLLLGILVPYFAKFSFLKSTSKFYIDTFLSALPFIDKYNAIQDFICFSSSSNVPGEIRQILKFKIICEIISFIFQLKVSSAAKNVPPGPQCVPPRDCSECPAGIVPRVVKTGCNGCPQCCEPLPCAPIECPTGSIQQQKLQNNGCPGCYACVVSA